MGVAAELRKQIERTLANRIPSALSPRPPVTAQLRSCGVEELDAVLGGGVPVGAITELTGAHTSDTQRRSAAPVAGVRDERVRRSDGYATNAFGVAPAAGAGRTTIALSTLAKLTAAGESCAYVDVSDALDPLSAAALGVDLRRLLWVRAGEADGGVRAARPAAVSPSAVVDESKALKGSRGGGWCHPRNETIGLDYAIGELFRHEPERPVDFTPRCSESIRRERPSFVSVGDASRFSHLPEAGRYGAASSPHSPKGGADVGHSVPALTSRNGQIWGTVAHNRQTSWARLEQGLRAVDLLLSCGGFGAVVLDMADVRPEQARRVPLATWYRFRLQAEKGRTIFLLLTRVPCAHSCAALSLECRQAEIEWTQAERGSPMLLSGVRYRAGIERNRAASGRKPPASEAAWQSRTAWMG
jgi:recombination protein RecA